MNWQEELVEFINKHFSGTQRECETPLAKSLDQDKQLFTSVVLRPNIVDLHGDIYDEDTVEKACHDYNEFCRSGNIQHLIQTELATPVESYIAKSDFNLGDGRVVSGDWVMTMKIKDGAIWEMCKDGVFTGFSVGCNGIIEDING